MNHNRFMVPLQAAPTWGFPMNCHPMVRLFSLLYGVPPFPAASLIRNLLTDRWPTASCMAWLFSPAGTPAPGPAGNIDRRDERETLAAAPAVTPHRHRVCRNPHFLCPRSPPR